MRVLVLAYTFYEHDNRVRRYAESLARDGHHVDVLALRKGRISKFGKIKNVNVFRIQKRKVTEKSKLTFIFKMLWFFIKSSIYTTYLYTKNRYKLVHVHSPPDLQVFAAWFPRIMGAKLILDIHDILPEFYISKFKSSKDSLLFKILLFFERRSSAFAHHIIIANHIWYETLINRSTTSKDCTVILNYPDPSIFSVKPSTRSAEKFILSYAGSLNYHQGLDIAVKAIALLKEKGTLVYLHIYGLGREKESLDILADKLGVTDQINFKGVVQLEEIPEVMTDVHIGVVPKRKDTFGNEAFSTKIFEFMAMGIPVIVADTKIDKYYFNDSLVCFFNSGDEESLAEKILILKEDSDLRDKLSQEGLIFAGKNNWLVKKIDYMSIVNTLLGENY